MSGALRVRLASIPPELPFLDTLARRLVGRADLADCLVLLPTRRAARGLAEAFLRVADGRAMLLPRIAALGAVDEAPLVLAGMGGQALELAPAVAAAERLAVLSRMILAMDGRFGAPRTLDRAWPLAAELARLMDEAARAEVDLAAALPGAAGIGWARHWEVTLEFLGIVTRLWPAWLAEQGLMDAQVRARRLLDAQGASWEARPPSHPVIVAGTTGGIPAVARLLRVVARLEHGLVVLPGLDLALDEAAWSAVGQGTGGQGTGDAAGGEAHPQASLKALLALIGASRGDVEEWPGEPADVPAGRVELLRLALLPAPALSRWGAARALELAGMSAIEAADQQEEALAIAIRLRQAIELPGARAALVTPDRALAARVTAELLRFGIVANDSAGEPLGQTPAGVFLRLLAAAATEAAGPPLSPVPLLALLKHPLAAAGLSPAACRAQARALERRCLRGPAPTPGVDGLLAGGGDAGFLGRLGERLAPLLRLERRQVAPEALIAALLAAAEAMAESEEAGGAARLWGGEEGAALARHLGEAAAALAGLPDQRAGNLSGLLDALLEGASVRGRRALRGREGVRGEHPRVFIWGLLEARLQSVELVILGGLAEGIWPPATDPGPWLSRPMRRAVGLPSPEEAVGLAAHDWMMSACSAPLCVLSRALRRDGAPAVPSRLWTRLAALLSGREMTLPADPALGWARLLDRPAGVPQPVKPPRPCPPVALRPRSLSVTQVEKWIIDPYAIYARHVLRLRPLEELDMSVDAIEYGEVVHDGISRFLADWPTGALPADAAVRLEGCLGAALADRRLRPAIAAWWSPRLRRIADWVAGEEARRRRERPVRVLAAELRGAWALDGGAGPFVLTARADRIECHEDGTVSILDYKTGVIPTEDEVRAGHKPQLPLEAAMAEHGGFDGVAGVVGEYAYWKLTGGRMPGEARSPVKAEEVRDITRQAAERFVALVRSFDHPAQPYLSQPHAGRPPRFSDYAQLARVGEWAAATEAE